MASQQFQLVAPEAPEIDISKSQWYTPPELAERIVAWAVKPLGNRRLRVLEPSAGRGALVRPLVALGHRVTAIDIDQDNAQLLLSETGLVRNADFLAHEDWPKADLAVMNPPFENAAAESHVLHALSFADRVVAHVPLTTLEGVDRKRRLWDRVSMPRMVIHSRRPKYSGRKSGGATAMCTVELVPELQDGCRTEIEWW